MKKELKIGNLYRSHMMCVTVFDASGATIEINRGSIIVYLGPFYTSMLGYIVSGWHKFLFEDKVVRWYLVGNEEITDWWKPCVAPQPRGVPRQSLGLKPV